MIIEIKVMTSIVMISLHLLLLDHFISVNHCIQQSVYQDKWKAAKIQSSTSYFALKGEKSQTKIEKLSDKKVNV